MHELSVCLELLDQIAVIAAERRASSVSRIVLKIGPLSGIEEQLLRSAYPIAAGGTVAEHAELRIERTAIVLHCERCRRESRARANRLCCAHCGDYRTRLISGDEMILQRLELENADPLSDTECGAQSAKGRKFQ